MNEESPFLQPFHQHAFALFFFLFTASISCFILHFVASNTIYSLPHCRSSWSTEQPQIKGRGKIAFVIRMAVGLQAAEIIICVEEKQQWEGVSGGCVCHLGLRVCGTLTGTFPPLWLQSCWCDDSSIQIFAHNPSVSCPTCSGSAEHESKGVWGNLMGLTWQSHRLWLQGWLSGVHTSCRPASRSFCWSSLF